MINMLIRSYMFSTQNMCKKFNRKAVLYNRNRNRAALTKKNVNGAMALLFSYKLAIAKNAQAKAAVDISFYSQTPDLSKFS